MSNEIIEAGASPAASEAELRLMSPVTLAFVGDAVFGLLVREHLVGMGLPGAAAMHRRAVGYVKAGAQALAAGQVLPLLTDEERGVFRRGRNANTSHVPKNANPIDYRHATGLEALFGYLYLAGSHERLRGIFGAVAAAVESGAAAEGGT